MHRYRIIAQISLIISILNLVLAAPIGVQETHEAPGGDETVVTEGVAEGGSTSPLSFPDSADARASLQHSPLSDGPASPGYPTPLLSSDESISGYSWLLTRPPRLNLNLPVSSSHPSGSGLPEIPLSWGLQGVAPELPPSPHSAGSSDVPPLGWAPEEIPPSPPAVWHGLVHPLPHLSTSSSGSSEIPSSLELTVSDDDGVFTLSHHPSSLSSKDSFLWHPGESMSTPYSSASGGSESLSSSHYLSASDGSLPSPHSTTEGLVPSHHLTSDGSSPSPSSPPTEAPPDNAEYFNKNTMKKLKIVAGVTIVGTAVIAGIVGSQIKHRKQRDFQDS